MRVHWTESTPFHTGCWYTHFDGHTDRTFRCVCSERGQSRCSRYDRHDLPLLYLSRHWVHTGAGLVHQEVDANTDTCQVDKFGRATVSARYDHQPVDQRCRAACAAVVVLSGRHSSAGDYDCRTELCTRNQKSWSRSREDQQVVRGCRL